MSIHLWNFASSVVIGTCLLILGYVLATGPLRRRYHWGEAVPLSQQMFFYLGTLCIFLALVSPLDVLGDEYLFSAHMAQHMLLSFIAPPLWLIGTPAWLIRRLVPPRMLTWMMNPCMAFILFNGAMWIWHLPAAYDSALTHEWLHIGEHLLFMAFGVTGFLPILRSELAENITPLHKLIYLFPAMLSCTALAALITLSSRQLYHFYGQSALQWGLTISGDQQLGGLAMWLPGDMLYMAMIAWVFIGLLSDENQEVQQVKI